MTPQNSARCLLVLVSLLLNACAADKHVIPQPLVKPRAELHPEDLEQALISHSDGSNGMTLSTSIQEIPKLPPAGKLSTVKNTEPLPVAVKDEQANITVAFDQLPLPNFIQAVYGLILKKNYSVDPQVAGRKDLVTLRASQLQTPAQIENAARLLLKTYGVTVNDLGMGNYRITPDNAQTGYAPEILRGRALPDVPLPLRPIYQMIELKAVRTGELISWLNKLFGSKVSIVEDSAHNTLILSGQPGDVAAVLETIDVLDQPVMMGRKSLRINPVFLSAEELSGKLSAMLNAEGYSATSSASASYPINLIPIQGLNAIVVFVSDAAVIPHIIEWAKEFDKPNTIRKSGGGYFTYKARYTNAEKLASTMQSVLGEAQAPAAVTYAPGQAPIGVSPAPPKAAGRVIVNAPTNTLIIQGSIENEAQLLNLLQELDKPAKSALIEVTVAEVTLDDSTQLGVEWAFNAAAAAAPAAGGAALVAGARPSITMGAGGMAIAYLNGKGDLRMLLNMLATSSKANVLSSPRIMARNGETATIQVGSQIPTINQQQTNAATGGTGVLQSVQYRNTGIILTVKPIIYAGDRIDLDITQEVSDSTKIGVASSPIIDTRRVDTRLSLKDGTPVLLGGLISQTNSQSDAGVPLLQDIPVLGQMFGSHTKNGRKTEMLVLITPYIVADDHDAQEITNAFRNRLGEWAQTETVPPVMNGKPVRKPTAKPLPVSVAAKKTAIEKAPAPVSAP
ncbi:MAG: secretin N-terminal domain-containing protein [Gallionella sp.]|nr:secretin N-terminal domain-containing protein [Gallionella sp.]